MSRHPNRCCNDSFADPVCKHLKRKVDGFPTHGHKDYYCDRMDYIIGLVARCIDKVGCASFEPIDQKPPEPLPLPKHTDRFEMIEV
jgi:hypothetical protein